jgi:hypothetical protein
MVIKDMREGSGFCWLRCVYERDYLEFGCMEGIWSETRNNFTC